MSNAATTTATEIAPDPRSLFTMAFERERLYLRCLCGTFLTAAAFAPYMACPRCRNWIVLRWSLESSQQPQTGVEKGGA